MGTSQKLSDDELIERYLEPNPNTSSPAKWHLKDEEHSYPVWVLIGVLAEDGSNAGHVIRDWDISPEALEAVRAYYRRNKRFIDAWNLVNSMG